MMLRCAGCAGLCACTSMYKSCQQRPLETTASDSYYHVRSPVVTGRDLGTG